MHIRRATLSDAGGIAAAHVAAWRTTYPGIVAREAIDRRTIDVRTRQWEGMMRGETREPPTVFVAEQDGEIVGFVSGGPIREPRVGFDGELYAIYLIDSTRRTGVGRRLVQRLAGALVGDGLRSMVVQVLAQNPACRFYERLGARLLEENDHTMDDRSYPGRMYGWDDISALNDGADA